jgi:tRNA 2-selenouridine synthase
VRRIQAHQFADSLLGPTTWIDVRAPIEFKAGSIPGAISLPLLTNEERHEIGIAYKNQGSEAALQLGHQLVSGQVRQKRVKAWSRLARANQNPIVFCFRGGLRSQIVQKWLAEENLDVPIIEGGYKALRSFLMQSLEDLPSQFQFTVVSGLTGTGKTKYLYESGENFIDLERIAKHRGSAFGAFEEPQPTQIDFENALALQLLELSKKTACERILIEDESHTIGSLRVPLTLMSKIQSAPRIDIVASLEDRVENIFKEYIENSKLAKRGDPSLFDDFERAVKLISRKLGGLRTQEVLNDLQLCRQDYLECQSLEMNRSWIRKLLLWYYDPAYNRSAERLLWQKSKIDSAFGG